MESIRRIVEENSGFYVLPIDGAKVLSNLVNIHLAGNRRAARITGLPPDITEGVLTLGLQDVDTFRRLKIEKLKAAKVLDTRTWITELDENTRGLFAALLAERTLVRDYGQCMYDSLGKIGGWETVFDIAPALGYPRRRVMLRSTPTFRDEANDWLTIPNPASDWNRAVGSALMRLDSFRFGPTLIPGLEDPPNDDRKSLPFGALKALLRQLEQIMSIGVLYLLQGSLYSLHIHNRLFRTAYELAYAIEQQYRPYLEFQLAAWDELLKLPLHPLLKTAADAFQTGSLAGEIGTKSLLYTWAPIAKTISAAGLAVGDDCGLRKGAFIDAIVRAALDDNEDARVVAGVDGALRLECRETYRWKFDTEEDGDTPLTVGEFARVVRGSDVLIRDATSLAAKIGWGSGGPNLDIGEVDALGAEWTLCDGELYSKSPAAGIVGISPVLSRGNIKLNGLDLRFDSTWNAKDEGERITESVLVVKGHQGANNTEQMYERTYIPKGMLMGETWASWVAGLTLPGGYGERVIKHWVTKAPKNGDYVNAGYGDAVITSDTPEMKQTDWDPWGTSGSESDVRTAWGTAMAAQFDKLKPLALAAAREGHVFYHRVVVSICHTYHYDVYDEQGGYTQTDEFRGFIVFNEVLNWTATSDLLERIVNVLPPMTSTGASQVDALLQQEITA